MIDALIDTLPPEQRNGYRGMFQRFIDWPPGTRVQCTTTDPNDHHIRVGDTGLILTHATDGCTLVAWDNPLQSEANATKPAKAWWTYVEYLKRV